MRRLLLGLVLLLSALCLSDGSYAGYAEGNAFTSGNTNGTPDPDSYGQVTVDKNVFLHAGERNQDSATTSYLVVRQEATATIITGTTAVTLGGGMPGDTHLMMLHIHTALTGTCVIEGFRDPAGNAETYILPAATIGKIDFMGAINDSGALAVTCSNAGDNKKVIAMWRPR